MLGYAKSFIGIPYHWGGENPISGFDCSGFVQEVLAAYGMDPPDDQTAQGLYNHFKKLGYGMGAAPCALVFYGSSIESITHIMICIDDQFCVGATGGGSKTVNLAAADSSNAFVKIRPILYRKDIVAIVKIFPET